MLSFHVLALLIAVEAIHVMISPGDEQCFWDHASEGEIISHWWDSLKEVNSDTLNVKIFAPNDQIIVELPDQSGEHLNFKASEDGSYTWCYENSGTSRIIVVFKNIVGLAKMSIASMGENEQVGGLDNEIQQLIVNSDSVWDSLNIYRERLMQHTVHADKALEAQTYFSLLKLVVFASSALSVVYWMKTLFETKRRI
jgi:hypothetical protein